MKTYSTPVYPALFAILPNGSSVKAAGGTFRIVDDDVEAFEAFAAKRPEYRITELSEEDDPVTTAPTIKTPEPKSTVEENPEIAQTSAVNIETASNEDLRAALKERGLSTKGNKDELQGRLSTAIAEEAQRAAQPVTAATESLPESEGGDAPDPDDDEDADDGDGDGDGE